MSGPALLLSPACAADAQAGDLAARLRLRGAACVALTAPVSPRILLAAVRGHDAARSWLATRDPGDVPAAATAGLLGVVLVGRDGGDRDDGVLVRHCPDLAAATIAMVPRGGGCWHDPPTP